MNPKIFANLRDALVHLYPDTLSLRVVLDDTGVDSSSINFTNKSEVDWHSALKEAEKTHKIDDLLATVARKYGNNSKFRDAYLEYYQLKSKDVEPVSVSGAAKYTTIESDKYGSDGSSNIVSSHPNQKQNFDFLRDPIWQFISVVVALLIPLLQSEPRLYILGVTIAFILSYIFFKSFRLVVNLAIIIYFFAVFFISPAFAEIRSNLNHIFKRVGIPEITTEGITTTDETTITGAITTTSAITSQSTIHNESLIGQVAKVDPVTAWNKLCLRESSLDRETCMEMQAGDEVTVLSNDKDGWVQVKHNQSNRKGYVMLRYLLFTEVQDTYINLFWRDKTPEDGIDDDCITAPRLELLSVNQPEGFCNPNVRAMSLNKLEEALYTHGMLDISESVILWGYKDSVVDSIRVITNGSKADYIKIGNRYPRTPDSLEKFLVGAIWREKTNPRVPIRKICWLKTNGEWFCEVP